MPQRRYRPEGIIAKLREAEVLLGHPRRVVEKDWRLLIGTIGPRLPESLHRKVRELAKPEDVSINL